MLKNALRRESLKRRYLSDVELRQFSDLASAEETKCRHGNKVLLLTMGLSIDLLDKAEVTEDVDED
jgi:hypothetical protein